MKKSIYFISGLGLFLGACTKELTNPLDSSSRLEHSKVESSALTINQKEDLLAAMANDPLFKDYLKSIIAIEKFHSQTLLRSTAYNFKKYKEAQKPTNEKEFVAGLRNAGFNDPEEFLRLTKGANEILRAVYKKHPLFSKSFTNDEKKAFFRKNIDLILDENEK